MRSKKQVEQSGRLFILFIFFFLLFTVSTSFAAEDFRKRGQEVEESFSDEDDVKAEVIFGRELAARIMGRYQLLKDAPLDRYVNMVGKGVSLYTNRTDIEFRFAVLDTDIINAYAAPGGYIFVTKGAIKAMEDEDELAGVLAHEVAHVTERHIVKELNIKGSETSPASGLAKVISGGTDTMRAAFSQMVDKAVEVLFEKGLKKSQELDSDRIATFVITNAGYDPTALRRYLAKISAKDKEIKSLIGTHPGFDERINSIDRILSENQLMGKKQSIVKGRFNENVKIR